MVDQRLSSTSSLVTTSQQGIDRKNKNQNRLKQAEQQNEEQQQMDDQTRQEFMKAISSYASYFYSDLGSNLSSFYLQF